MKILITSFALLLPVLPAAAQDLTADERRTTEEVVAAFGEAQSRGDAEALLELFAPDGQWRVDGAPDLPWVGDHRGRAAIAGLLETFGENVEVVAATRLDEWIAGDAAFQINRMELRLTRSGRAATSHTVVPFEVEDGLIAKHNVYENSYDVAVAYRDAPLFRHGAGPDAPRLPLPEWTRPSARSARGWR